jgi:hypothetical protein
VNMAVEINKKYEYCGYLDESSDKDFLGFIYCRLNSVFDESPQAKYMKRLDEIINKTPGKIRVGCDCSDTDVCPQGRLYSRTRCSIWKE